AVELAPLVRAGHTDLAAEVRLAATVRLAAVLEEAAAATLVVATTLDPAVPLFGSAAVDSSQVRQRRFAEGALISLVASPDLTVVDVAAEALGRQRVSGA